MYLGRLVGPWSLVFFPGCRALLFIGNVWRFLAKNDQDTATHAWAIIN